MVQFSRRHFLQAAGASLTSLGLHSAFNRHQAVLAQSTPRKLALLVGINDYADAPLFGCVNDTVLQKFLLVHRFGFNPKDVVVLTDGQATRQGILDAFEEHLIKQAKPGDVAMFHYSGHGSLVRDPDPIFVTRRGRGVNGTFVPADSHLPSNYPAEGGTVSDIMGHTLFLLMSAMQTENFTAVLDSCFSGAAAREYPFTVRSREVEDNIEIAPQEKAYQEQWLSRLDWSHEEYVERYQRGIANGVVLAATQRNQLAVDEPLSKVLSVGAFTFRLTQHLWQTDSTPEAAIAHINSLLPRNYRQNPKWEAEPNSGYEQDPILFMEPPNATADAVVLNVTDSQATIFLVGVKPGEVEPGQFFRVQGRRSGVRIMRREGLAAVGRIEGRVRVDDALRRRQ